MAIGSLSCTVLSWFGLAHGTGTLQFFGSLLLIDSFDMKGSLSNSGSLMDDGLAHVSRLSRLDRLAHP